MTASRMPPNKRPNEQQGCNKSRQLFACFSARFCRLLSLLYESRYVEEMMFIRSHNCLLFTKLQLLKNFKKMLAMRFICYNVNAVQHFLAGVETYLKLWSRELTLLVTYICAVCTCSKDWLAWACDKMLQRNLNPLLCWNSCKVHTNMRLLSDVWSFP